MDPILRLNFPLIVRAHITCPLMDTPYSAYLRPINFTNWIISSYCLHLVRVRKARYEWNNLIVKRAQSTTKQQRHTTVLESITNPCNKMVHFTKETNLYKFPRISYWSPLLPSFYLSFPFAFFSRPAIVTPKRVRVCVPSVRCSYLLIAFWILEKNNVIGWHGVCFFVYSRKSIKTSETERMKGTEEQGRNGKEGREEGVSKIVMIWRGREVGWKTTRTNKQWSPDSGN